MTEIPDWKCIKWPFLLADAVLLGIAAAFIFLTRQPVSHAFIYAAASCAAVGALLACLPFYLDYRAAGKLIEVHAVGEVSEKIQDLKNVASQVASTTDQWARVQETTRGHAEKSVTAAAEIAERMTTEVRDFTQFQAKMNDTEKAALRLEGEKLRRAEGEWLQVVARILDHTFALHTAASRSGQPELAEQIGNFQNACRDSARRVGLAQFEAAADEPFDAERHRAHGVENPTADLLVAETLAPGITFQGRLVRPALVKLQEPQAPPASAAETVETPPEKTASPASGQLSLEAD
jgi:molecular chaperone GrpE (heat shock protein)